MERVQKLEQALTEVCTVLKDALIYHGTRLLSDPPQDAWKYHKVEERGRIALEVASKALAPEADFETRREYPITLGLRTVLRVWSGEQTNMDVWGEYKVGDLLWVRERFAERTDINHRLEPARAKHYCIYKANGARRNRDPMNWHTWGEWQPASDMPRCLSRMTLTITGVEQSDSDAPSRIHFNVSRHNEEK